MNCVMYRAIPTFLSSSSPKNPRDSWICLGQEEEEFPHAFSHNICVAAVPQSWMVLSSPVCAPGIDGVQPSNVMPSE